MKARITSMAVGIVVAGMVSLTLAQNQTGAPFSGGTNAIGPNGQRISNGRYNPYAPPPSAGMPLTNNVTPFSNSLPNFPGGVTNGVPPNNNNNPRFLNPPGQPTPLSNVPPGSANQLVVPNNNNNEVPQTGNPPTLPPNQAQPVQPVQPNPTPVQPVQPRQAPATPPMPPTPNR